MTESKYITDILWREVKQLLKEICTRDGEDFKKEWLNFKMTLMKECQKKDSDEEETQEHMLGAIKGISSEEYKNLFNRL